MNYNDITRYKVSSKLGLGEEGLFGKCTLIIVVLFLVLSSFMYFSSSFRDKMYGIFESSSMSFYAVFNLLNNTAIETKNTFFNYIDLQEKYQDLLQENDKLKSEHLKYVRTLKENEFLKKTFGYHSKNPKKILSTEIFSQSLGGYIEQAKILAGSLQGVRINDAVVTNDKLVGRVNKVSENSSNVLLITGPNSKIPVVFSDTNIKAILQGTQSNKLIVSMLNVVEDDLPSVGELVVTSGDGYFFAPGLLVGTVTKSNHAVVEVTPFFDVHNMQIVSILRE